MISAILPRRLIAAVGFAALLIGVGGCVTRSGDIQPATQFIYPNSNITPLGPVEGSVSHVSVFFGPTLTLADVKSAYAEALSKASGANILMNYKEDTTLTTIPIPILTIYIIKYGVAGDAGHMDVGMKNLH